MQCCISFRHTTQRSDTYVPYGVRPLVRTAPSDTSYCNTIDHIPYAELYTHVTISVTGDLHYLMPSPLSSSDHRLVLCVYEFVPALLIW